jgi:hypothetical protein
MLHWKITTTPVTMFFPLGVKSTYFAYPTDEAIEIVKSTSYKWSSDKKSRYITGLEPLRTISIERPTVEDNEGGPAGMIALYCLPEGLPEVAEFKKIAIKDSKGVITLINVVEHLRKMVKAISDAHGSQSETYKEWVQFHNVFPQGDAQSYIKSPGNNYRIPFASFFDGSNPDLHVRKELLYGSDKDVKNGHQVPSDDIPVAEAQATVAWGPYGKGWIHHRVGVEKEARIIKNHELHGLTSPYLHVTEDDEGIHDSMPYEAMLNTTLQKTCKRMGLNSNGDKLDLVSRLRNHESFISKLKSGVVKLKPSVPYNQMTAKELQNTLKTCGLSKTGNKDILLKRLLDAFTTAGIDPESDIVACGFGMETSSSENNENDIIIEKIKTGIAQLVPNSKPFIQMNVEELKHVLKLCGLARTGKKEVLLKRLMDSLALAGIKDEFNDEEDDGKMIVDNEGSDDDEVLDADCVDDVDYVDMEPVYCDDDDSDNNVEYCDELKDLNRISNYTISQMEGQELNYSRFGFKPIEHTWSV